MDEGEFEWAGVRFLAVGHHDACRVRGAGLYGFVRRGAGDERVLLYVDHADCIALAAHVGHPLWAEALGLGMNEIHVCLKAHSRLDRLQLRHHLIRRTGPILNLLGAEESRDPGLSAPSARRQAG
jgi:hypothetical protein